MTSLPSIRRTSYLPRLSTDDSLYGVTSSLPSGLYRWFWQSPAGFLQFISHHPQKWSVTQSPSSMHPSISPRSTGLVYFTPPPLRKLHSRISSGLQDVLITAKTAWSHPVGARNLNQNRQQAIGFLLIWRVSVANTFRIISSKTPPSSPSPSRGARGIPLFDICRFLGGSKTSTDKSQNNPTYTYNIDIKYL